MGDRWIDRDADGAGLGPSVQAAAHPGTYRRGHRHGGVHARGRVRLHARVVGADGPPEDPLGSDAAALHVSWARLLSFASVIVPGHGAAFRPDRGTPR